MSLTALGKTCSGTDCEGHNGDNLSMSMSRHFSPFTIVMLLNGALCVKDCKNVNTTASAFDDPALNTSISSCTSVLQKHCPEDSAALTPCMDQRVTGQICGEGWH